MKIIVSTHAAIELQRRNISRETVLKTAKNPQQKLKTNGTWICQSKYIDSVLKKEILLRVFVREDIKDVKIITAYKTSKISKYWSVDR